MKDAEVSVERAENGSDDLGSFQNFVSWSATVPVVAWEPTIAA